VSFGKHELRSPDPQKELAPSGRRVRCRAPPSCTSPPASRTDRDIVEKVISRGYAVAREPLAAYLISAAVLARGEQNRLSRSEKSGP